MGCPSPSLPIPHTARSSPAAYLNENTIVEKLGLSFSTTWELCDSLSIGGIIGGKKRCCHL